MSRIKFVFGSKIFEIVYFTTKTNLKRAEFVKIDKTFSRDRPDMQTVLQKKKDYAIIKPIKGRQDGKAMETERLIIDALRERDKADYFEAISHDRKVLQTFICNYEENMESFDFSRNLAIPDLFAIRLKETGKLIGIILICEKKETSCEIGYGIGSAYWNRGYVTEATKRFLEYCFCEHGFETVYASFFTGNEASRRVMEKCGMKYSHFVEKELTYLGMERDLTYYAINKEEYNKIYQK